MGKGSEWITASSGNCFGSCEAHTKNLSRRQKENRGGTAGKVGEVQSGEEEGGLEPAAYVFLTSMNLQHWIDQHPSVFAAIFPIYFLLLGFWSVQSSASSVDGSRWRRSIAHGCRSTARNGECRADGCGGWHTTTTC